MPASNHKTDQNLPQGRLSVVATPIGNLADISARAVQTLRDADLVLAEDTRHSRPLFSHYSITTPLKACHEHNEADLVDWVITQIRKGQRLALISDAGTPLISDPGFLLVRALREQGCPVEVVPGASSIIAALSVSGMPTDRFVYDGFLPTKSAARQRALQSYEDETRTIVLLESSHRIDACLRDIEKVYGATRRVVLARELTKKFETVLAGTAQELLLVLAEDANQQRGEFVLLLQGVQRADSDAKYHIQLRQTLRILLAELPLKQAASLAAKLTDTKKNEAYQLALEMRDAVGE